MDDSSFDSLPQIFSTVLDILTNSFNITFPSSNLIFFPGRVDKLPPPQGREGDRELYTSLNLDANNWTRYLIYLFPGR